MNDPGNGPRGGWKWWRNYGKQVLIAVSVTLIVGFMGWVVTTTIQKLEIRPLTVNFDPVSGQANIARFFEHQIRPHFNAYCSRPRWKRWLAKKFFGQECIRLRFDPHTLESMRTKRVPYEETAEPRELLQLFLVHHRGCLTHRREGDMLIISEPENSVLKRVDGIFVCP